MNLKEAIIDLNVTIPDKIIKKFKEYIDYKATGKMNVADGLNTDIRNATQPNISGIGKIPNYNNIISDYPSIKGSLYCMGPGQAGDDKFYISWYNEKGSPTIISFSDDSTIQ